MLKDLVKNSRSYRRFYQDHKIELSQLKDLVNLARLSPTGKNAQPLKFILSNDPELNQKIFEPLAWAAYLKDWHGPTEGEKPSGYIIICGDKNIANNYFIDHGIAAQSIMLGAVEMGLGGCIFASIQREKLRQNINLPDHLEILLVLALGKPKEEVVVDEIKGGDIKYWRDENQVHHVPKRSLEELIINYK